MKSHARSNIVTFGEVMLRLTPYVHREQIIHSDALRMSFAGAESNTSISLANWGYQVTMVTSFPNNILGDTAMAYLHKWNIDTSGVMRNNRRMGTYYIEHGVSIRPTQVVYDRKDSAVAATHPDYYEWEKIFEGKKLFYLTGITPALSEHTEQACRDALREAKRQGLLVLFDPNYRSTLWKKETAANVFKDFYSYIDVLIANVGSAKDVMGYVPMSSPTDYWEALEQDSIQAVSHLHQYTKIPNIALSIRKAHSANHHTLGGILSSQGKIVKSQPIEVEVVDRLGGGDAFAAGLIHGWIQQWNPATIISYATASAALQQTLPGDLNILSQETIMKLASGERAGDVKR